MEHIKLLYLFRTNTYYITWNNLHYTEIILFLNASLKITT